MTNKIVMCIVFLSLTFLLPLVPSSRVTADTVTVAHGDQLMFTLENDGTVIVNQTILFTSNKTASGIYIENQSADGTLIGEPELIPDSSMEDSEVVWKSEENITTFIIRINATLEPTKFKALKLNYHVNGLLQREFDGSWSFRYVFTMAADAIAPPEIVVKIPKPSWYEELTFQEIIPTPSVSLDESGYYVMSWKSAAVTFGNVTETLVRLRYSTRFSAINFLLYITPIIIGIIIAIPSWLWSYHTYRRKKVQASLEARSQTPKQPLPNKQRQKDKTKSHTDETARKEHKR